MLWEEIREWDKLILNASVWMAFMRLGRKIVMCVCILVLNALGLIVIVWNV